MPDSKNADHDRVVIASRKRDGTPDQDDNFTFIGDKDVAIKANSEQLAVQAASALDVAHRGVSSGTAGEAEPDPEIKKLKDAQDAAAKAAEAQAKSEVNARHEDVKEEAKDNK